MTMHGCPVTSVTSRIKSIPFHALIININTINTMLYLLTLFVALILVLNSDSLFKQREDDAE